MSSLRPGNHDRAWNDPPVFAYSGPPKSDDSQPPKRNLLNKRVAFPMSGPSPSSQSAAATLVPLLPMPSNPHISIEASITAAPEDCSFTEPQFEKIFAIFDERVKENDVKPDILKRLQAMATLWKEGKLNQDICKRLNSMAESLSNGDVTAAETIRVSLAVDYSAECAGWITAFKHIINVGEQ